MRIILALLMIVSLSACASIMRTSEPTLNQRMLQEQKDKMATGQVDAPLAIANTSDVSHSSLWAKSAGNPYLVRNQKAQNVGDLLTILIDESATASTSAKTDAKKEADLGLGADLSFGRSALGAKGKLSGTSEYSSELKGQGKTDRSGQFQATVQAVVENVLNNGTLFVRGRKVITINNEDQEVEISGFVRPDDIRINNTVVSSVMADAEIRYLGKGVVGDKQRGGWGTRVLDWVWPF
ncbi:MAG: flagellar basal body L-ring protein FlgH [Bdellovibrionota bacterium]